MDGDEGTNSMARATGNHLTFIEHALRGVDRDVRENYAIGAEYWKQIAMGRHVYLPGYWEFRINVASESTSAIPSTRKSLFFASVQPKSPQSQRFN